eukprot:scaffold134854_cov72-Phaeocystis_antarctica.AAC.1
MQRHALTAMHRYLLNSSLYYSVITTRPCSAAGRLLAVDHGRLGGARLHDRLLPHGGRRPHAP